MRYGNPGTIFPALFIKLSKIARRKMLKFVDKKRVPRSFLPVHLAKGECHLMNMRKQKSANESSVLFHLSWEIYEQHFSLLYGTPKINGRLSLTDNIPDKRGRQKCRKSVVKGLCLFTSLSRTHRIVFFEPVCFHIFVRQAAHDVFPKVVFS